MVLVVACGAVLLCVVSVRDIRDVGHRERRVPHPTFFWLGGIIYRSSLMQFVATGADFVGCPTQPSLGWVGKFIRRGLQLREERAHRLLRGLGLRFVRRQERRGGWESRRSSGRQFRVPSQSRIAFGTPTT